MALLAFAFAGCAECNVPSLAAFPGDGLTEGGIVPRCLSYPALVAAALADSARTVRVVNEGRGGYAGAQGRAHLADVLHRQPDVVGVALGISDDTDGILAGTCDDLDLPLADGLHPSALGQRRLAANVRPALGRVLDELPRHPDRPRR